MDNRTYYIVETRHPVSGSKWDGQHVFRVSAFRDRVPGLKVNGPLHYYATAKNFGCGKSCRTPEQAIHHLAEDNGAEVLNLCIQYEEEN